MKNEMKTRTVIPVKPKLDLGLIGDTDSYKYSQAPLYHPDTTQMESYFGTRGGDFSNSTLFGLQIFMHEVLSQILTMEGVDAEEKFAIDHGEPFNRKGFETIVKKYGGRPPITIRAIPEGMIVPIGTPLIIIKSVNDPDVFWFGDWLENKISRLWGPSTVAIQSREYRKLWKRYLDLSSDDPDAEIDFKVHDFGSRGCASEEQAKYHGAAHLLSFKGSDTTAGIKAANYYYDCPMSGLSIAATQHSLMSAEGRAGEFDVVERAIKKYLIDREVPPGVPKYLACVGDTYDIFNFTRMICSERFLPMIEKSGGTFIIRPDSGSHQKVLLEMFGILKECLKSKITTNNKKFTLLPPYLRLIWGDGISLKSSDPLLDFVANEQNWSVSNLATGSGGALLQKLDRDTQKFAMKCSAIRRGGQVYEVKKDPITDSGKQSKAGRLDVIRNSKGEIETVVLADNQDEHPDSVMNTVFENGDILFHTTFDECRERMKL